MRLGRSAREAIQPWVKAGVGVVLKEEPPLLELLLRRGVLSKEEGGYALTYIGEAENDQYEQRLAVRPLAFDDP